MIEKKEQEHEAHMGSMQLLGALQVSPKPSTSKTSLLSGAQVKKAKRERAEVAKYKPNGEVITSWQDWL